MVATGQGRLDKATVQAYKAKLQADGLAPSTVNLQLSAVRKLAAEAADNGVLDQGIANGIGKVRHIKTADAWAGNWLTQDQTRRLLNAPDVATIKGLRDRAVLAVMVGCGLRRSEVAALSVEHIPQREGRWVIVDLVGKGPRVLRALDRSPEARAAEVGSAEVRPVEVRAAEFRAAEVRPNVSTCWTKIS